MASVKATKVLVVCSAFAFGAAAYFFLWAISNVELAFVDCNGTFSLHAANFRCQRPILLIYAFYAFAFLGAALGIWAFIRWRRAGAST